MTAAAREVAAEEAIPMVVEESMVLEAVVVVLKAIVVESVAATMAGEAVVGARPAEIPPERAAEQPKQQVPDTRTA